MAPSGPAMSIIQYIGNYVGLSRSIDTEHYFWFKKRILISTYHKFKVQVVCACHS